MAADSGRGATNVLLMVGIAALVLSGTALALWVWILTSSNRPAPAAEPAMLAMPESSLVYPNATHVQKVGEGTECRDGFWQPAGIEFIFTTNDPTVDVFTRYSQQLGPLGWKGQLSEAVSTGFSLTRDTDELYEIKVSLNPDGSPYRVGSSRTQFITDFQHTFKSGRC